ncbi:MAG: hypothetical protein Tsb0027_25560 [Wenzhouxiangellaceae bacterium]
MLYPAILFPRHSVAQGSTGNVIAALASFFIPGLGQLLQGRWILAGFMFVLAALLWLILLGWIIHLRSFIDAAGECSKFCVIPFSSIVKK